MNTLSTSLSRAAAISAQRLAVIGFLITLSAGIGRAANTTEFWDPSGAAIGGAGTWDAGTTAAWSTSASGGAATVWPNATGNTTTAIFQGAAGTGSVTLGVGANISVNTITFNTTGYTILDTAGDTTAVLNFGSSTTSTGTINYSSASNSINSAISDSGTLVLNGGTSEFLGLNGNNTGLTGTVTLNGANGTIGISSTGIESGASVTASNGFGTATVEANATTAINYRNSGDNTASTQTLNYGNNFIVNTTGSLTFNMGQVSGGSSSNKTFAFGNVTFNQAGAIGLVGSLTNTAPKDRISFSGVTLGANGTFIMAAAGGFASVGAITETGGAHSVTFEGVGNTTFGTFTITGASSNSGGTFITEGTVQDGIANAVSETGSVTVGSAAQTGGSTLNLNGFSQQVGGLASAGTAASDIITNSGTSSVLTYSGATSTYGGVISDSGAGKTLAVTMSTGDLTLSGTNTYIGATTINGGTLKVTGKLATGSAVAINNTGTLYVSGTAAGTVGLSSGGTLSGAGGTIGALTVAGGGAINTVDGTIGTLNGSTLALNGNATLGMEISTGSTADELLFSGAATIGSGDVFTVNVTALNGVNAGTYVIASASTGLVAADFSAGALTNLTGYTATFTQGTGDTIDLVIQSSNPASTNYYFTGANSGSFTDAGNYNTTASGNTSQTGNALSASSNVFLDANSVSNTPPTLASTATINSLTFVTAGETLAGNTGNLTIAAGSGTGITDSATGGTTETIQPEVTLGASQGWTVSNSSNTLAVSGSIAGTSGQTLTLNGPGKFVFSSGATGTNFAGNTTLASGSLFITNGNTGSALGTGTFTVDRGATFGGAGTASGLAAFSIGNTGSGTTQIQVGNGTDTSSKLTLAANGASTISNANLTFNLSTSSTAANQLNLGNTAITFSNTTLTLNMTGGQIVSPDTAYVLITDANGFQGLTTSGNVITGGLTIAANSFFGTESGGFSTGFYNGSYLFLADGGTQIDVEVVPEPGTWALMLGGLGMLFFWQRRRKAQRV